MRLALAAIVVAIVGGIVHSLADLGRARDLHGAQFAGSGECARCHPDHYESWHRTYHRRMTQEATSDAVIGDFADGASLEYFGWIVRFRRDGDGFFARFDAPDGRVEEHRIVRTVGSHRYQQYLARVDDLFVRLPFAWHVEEDRWIHMNGAFLTPDPIDEVASRDDFMRHVTRWNDNCIFCHNVGANPGVEMSEGPAARYDSEVAELGVACEACHGPAAEHVARNANPLRRYALHLDAHEADPTVVDPGALHDARSSEICARCHGQRKTDQLESFLRDGDPFVPGDTLSAYSEPLWRDSTLDGEPVFALRFWDDGSPRLTAYEYQGWLQSPCTQDGTPACTACHGMHEGDPAGQLRTDAARDGGCGQCHARDSTPEHDRHPDTACVDCHMPRVVYGLVDTHRTHRVEIPDPESARIDACALCHVDRLFEHLFGGDPIERSVAAAAIGRSELEDARVLRGWLLETMEHDTYPAVRRIAFRALRQRTPSVEVDAFRPGGTPNERRAAVRRLRARIDHRVPDRTRVDSLIERAEQHAIEIGE